MTERDDACPDCGHYDGADPFDERPWECDNCGAFFPKLTFRDGGRYDD